MSLETINALTQAGIGALIVIATIIFVWRFPQNADALQKIVEQIRQTAEAGVDRIEAANGLLMDAVKLLQESNTAAIDSRNRLEHRYETLQADVIAIKRDFEQQLAAKEAEIEALKAQIKILETADKQKDKTIEQLQKDLQKALAEKDDIERRLKAVEGAQEGKQDDTALKAA